MGQPPSAGERREMIYASAAADSARRLAVDEFRVKHHRHRCRRVVGVTRDPGAHTCGCRNEYVSRVKCQLQEAAFAEGFYDFSDRFRHFTARFRGKGLANS